MTTAQTIAHTEFPIECIFLFAGEEGVIYVKSTADADRDPLAIVKDWLRRSTGKQSAAALHENGAANVTVSTLVFCPKDECIRQADHTSFHLDEKGVAFDDKGDVFNIVATESRRNIREEPIVDLVKAGIIDAD